MIWRMAQTLSDFCPIAASRRNNFCSHCALNFQAQYFLSVFILFYLLFLVLLANSCHYQRQLLWLCRPKQLSLVVGLTEFSNNPTKLLRLSSQTLQQLGITNKLIPLHLFTDFYLKLLLFIYHCLLFTCVVYRGMITFKKYKTEVG